MKDQVHIYELNTDKDISGGELLLSSDTDHTTKPIRVDDLKEYITRNYVTVDEFKKLEVMVKSLSTQTVKLPWWKRIFK